MPDQNPAATALQPVDPEVVEHDLSRAERALAKVEHVEIDTAADYKRVGKWLTQAKEQQGALTDRRNRFLDPTIEVKRQAEKIRKETVALFEPPIGAYGQIVGVLTRKLAMYDRRKEEEARERERKVEEERRARRQQIKEAEAAAAAEGDRERAAELKAEATRAPISFPQPPHQPEKIAGLAKQKTFRARLIDREKFVAGVLSGEIPLDAVKIEPNTVVLSQMARNREGKNPPPGIEFYEHVTFAKNG